MIIVRRQLKTDTILGIECDHNGLNQVSWLEGAEDVKAFDYSVLVTSLRQDLPALFQHYRDRADCENNFDELKNQWGWSGFTTQDIKSCRLMARTIALIDNRWNLYTRLALPGKHQNSRAYSIQGFVAFMDCTKLSASYLVTHDSEPSCVKNRYTA